MLLFNFSRPFPFTRPQRIGGKVDFAEVSQ